jgi:pimeloyl-ACP methyl ester carboxylesterase
MRPLAHDPAIRLCSIRHLSFGHSPFAIRHSSFVIQSFVIAMPASLDGVIFRSQGCRLLGTFFRARTDRPCPTVLLLHGIPGVEKNYDLAYALRAAGWNCFIFHYRGCWGSEGVYSLPGILDDVSAAIAYLHAHPSVDPQRLVGAGLSLGGWGVVMSAAREREARLRGVISINPLVDPQARPLTDAEAADFAAMLNGISPAEVQAQWLALTPLPSVVGNLASRPALLLTGDADTFFDVDHQRLLAETLPRTAAEWRRIPGANHTFDDHRGVLVRTVLDWLTHTFPSQEHSGDRAAFKRAVDG